MRLSNDENPSVISLATPHERTRSQINHNEITISRSQRREDADKIYLKKFVKVVQLKRLLPNEATILSYSLFFSIGEKLGTRYISHLNKNPPNLYRIFFSVFRNFLTDEF